MKDERKGGTHKTIVAMRRLTLLMLGLAVTLIVLCIAAISKKPNYTRLWHEKNLLEYRIDALERICNE